MEREQFIRALQDRMKKQAVNIIHLYAPLRKTDAIRVVGKQLIRSSTSTAANYRAACRARSSAEFYAKMSIVVEEADEVVFWFEILREAELVSKDLLEPLHREAQEILSIVAKARKTAKYKGVKD